MKEERSQIADKAPSVIPSESRDLGSSRGRQRPGFFVAFVPRNDRLLRVLILGAVLSLAINVATRYTTITPQETSKTKSTTSQSLDVQRQHLLNDGLHWSAPAAKFVLFEPARLSVAMLPSISPVTGIYSEACLYDRPPPYC
jgi:hypothetical protein